MKYDVFVSYRRSSFESANLIAEKLRSMGYSVFFDVETLRAGNFNDQLFQVIDTCTDFVLVLPQNALDRCSDAEDWVRKEVIHAMSKNKNIVPVMLAGFEWPNPMPTGMEKLSQLQAITAGEKEFFDLSMKRLASYLKSKPNRDMRKFYKKLVAVIAVIMTLIGITSGVILQMAKNLCYDIGVSFTLEMGLLNILRVNQSNNYKFWLDYKEEISKPNISQESIIRQTKCIQEILQKHEDGIKPLYEKAEKYTNFTAFQKMLLSIYDFVPQDIIAFSGFYDALFSMALENISFQKAITSPQMHDVDAYLVEKHYEGWGYVYKALYYIYMGEMSKMPKKVQEYYYEHPKLSAIEDPITLNRDQKEYEKLSNEEMAKYQNIAKEIQIAVEKFKSSKEAK